MQRKFLKQFLTVFFNDQTVNKNLHLFLHLPSGKFGTAVRKQTGNGFDS